MPELLPLSDEANLHNWRCSRCSFTSRDAHVPVILDHLAIFGRITNRECQTLLRLPSSHTVSRILSAMDLPYTGSICNRKYYKK